MCCFCDYCCDDCLDFICCNPNCKHKPLTCYFTDMFFEFMDSSEKIHCSKCAPASEEYPQCIICFPCYFPICIAVDIFTWPCRALECYDIFCSKKYHNSDNNNYEDDDNDNDKL